jgi:hypothetical protein
MFTTFIQTEFRFRIRGGSSVIAENLKGKRKLSQGRYIIASDSTKIILSKSARFSTM